MDEIFKDFMKNIAKEVLGFRSITIVSVNTADIVGTKHVKDISTYDVQEDAMRQLQTYYSALKGIGSCSELIKEVLITTENYIYMYDVICPCVGNCVDEGFIAVLVVDRKETSLGTTRSCMKKNHKALAKRITDL